MTHHSSRQLRDKNGRFFRRTVEAGGDDQATALGPQPEEEEDDVAPRRCVKRARFSRGPRRSDEAGGPSGEAGRDAPEAAGSSTMVRPPSSAGPSTIEKNKAGKGKQVEVNKKAMSTQITPLSGAHPFFSIILTKRQLERPYVLEIPPSLQHHLPAARMPAWICYGKQFWETRYCGDHKCRSLGQEWRNFAVHNRLRIGDSCVFEIMKQTSERTGREYVDSRCRCCVATCRTGSALVAPSSS